MSTGCTPGGLTIDVCAKRLAWSCPREQLHYADVASLEPRGGGGNLSPRTETTTSPQQQVWRGLTYSQERGVYFYTKFEAQGFQVYEKRLEPCELHTTRVACVGAAACTWSSNACVSPAAAVLPGVRSDTDFGGGLAMDGDMLWVTGMAGSNGKLARGTIGRRAVEEYTKLAAYWTTKRADKGDVTIGYPYTAPGLQYVYVPAIWNNGAELLRVSKTNLDSDVEVVHTLPLLRQISETLRGATGVLQPSFAVLEGEERLLYLEEHAVKLRHFRTGTEDTLDSLSNVEKSQNVKYGPVIVYDACDTPAPTPEPDTPEPTAAPTREPTPEPTPSPDTPQPAGATPEPPGSTPRPPTQQPLTPQPPTRATPPVPSSDEGGLDSTVLFAIVAGTCACVLLVCGALICYCTQPVRPPPPKPLPPLPSPEPQPQQPPPSQQGVTSLRAMSDPPAAAAAAPATATVTDIDADSPMALHPTDSQCVPVEAFPPLLEEFDDYRVSERDKLQVVDTIRKQPKGADPTQGWVHRKDELRDLCDIEGIADMSYQDWRDEQDTMRAGGGLTLKRLPSRPVSHGETQMIEVQSPLTPLSPMSFGAVGSPLGLADQSTRSFGETLSGIKVTPPQRRSRRGLPPLVFSAK